MKCCKSSYIMRYDDKLFCHNCYKIYEPSIDKKELLIIQD